MVGEGNGEGRALFCFSLMIAYNSTREGHFSFRLRPLLVTVNPRGCLVIQSTVSELNMFS